MKLDEMDGAEILLPFDSARGLTRHAFCHREECFDDDTRRDARDGVVSSEPVGVTCWRAHQ